MSPQSTVPCPHCGVEIPLKATACQHCGSDEQTGWSDSTYLDGIDIPDDDDYEEIRAQEFGNSGGSTVSTVSWKTVIGAVVLLVFAWLLLRNVL